MSAPIEALDALQAGAADTAASVNTDMWSQMLAVRANSVLQADVHNQEVDAVPTDTVAMSTAVAPTAPAVDAGMQRTATLDDRTGDHLQDVGDKRVAEVEESKAAAQEQVDIESASLQYQQQQMAEARQMARAYLQQQLQEHAGPGGLETPDDRQDAATFLTAGGHDLLKEAGDDPLKIQEALGVLADAGLEAGRANELYQATYDMMAACGLDASLGALVGDQNGADLQATQSALTAAQARVAQCDQSQAADERQIDIGQNDVLLGAMASADADATAATALAGCEPHR